MFPSHEEFPRFAWIETRNSRSSTYQYMDIEYELDLSGGNLYSVRATIALPPANNTRNKRALRYKLIIRYREHFQVDGSTPIQSIITATKGKQKVQWKGSLVILAHKVDGTRDPLFDNATAQDLRDVTDWLCRYDGTAASVSPLQPNIDITAFRINSPAYIRATNAPEFVPVNDQVRSSDFLSAAKYGRNHHMPWSPSPRLPARSSRQGGRRRRHPQPRRHVSRDPNLQSPHRTLRARVGGRKIHE